MTIPAELQAIIDQEGDQTQALLRLWQERSQPATTISTWTLPEQARPGLQQLITDTGSLEAAIQRAWADAYNDRNTKRAVQEQVAALEAKVAELSASAAASSTPGSITLTADQAATYEAYKALGTVEEATAKIEAGDTAGTRLAELERSELLRQVAEVAGYDARILADRDQAAGGLDYEIVEETGDDGTATRRAVVTGSSGATDLTEYARAEWAPYLAILQPNGAGSQGDGSASQGAAGVTTTHIRQHAGSGQGNEDTVTAFLRRKHEQEAARPNPLQPAKE